jgi:hypothetical protein
VIGTGEDLDLDAGGGDDLGLGDTDTTPDAATPEPAAAGDEGPLLDAPAKRDDRDRRTTPKSQTAAAKGKKYVSKSKRGGDGRNGRIQNYTGIAIPKPKDIIPGMSDLKSYSRGIYEAKGTNYNEEVILFEASTEVRNLLEELEKSEIKVNENEAQ